MLFGSRRTPEAFVFYCTPKEVRNMRKTQSFLRVSLTLLALASLLFAGCSSSSDDDGPALAPAEPAPVDTSAGIEVYEYNDPATKVSGTITFTQYGHHDENDNFIFSNLSSLGLNNLVVTDGEFTVASLGTPSPTEPEDWYEIAIVTPSSARVLSLYEFRGAAGGQDANKFLTYQNPDDDDDGVGLMYANKDATIIVKSEYAHLANINLQLKAGWNYTRGRDVAGVWTLTSGTPGSQYKWLCNPLDL
jgi:hypothetical protein